jgi:hypothetical protein
LSNHQQQRNITAMASSQPVLSALLVPTILLAPVAGAAHAGPADCELNTFALARVVSKEPRVNFVGGRSERTPACPSAESACRLKAHLVPGDEVLMDAADAGYVCALFKSQGGIETTGWLPRTALELVTPRPAPAREWEGKWQRDRDTQIVIKSRAEDVAVSGNAIWGGHDRERVKRGAIHTGVLNGKGRPRGQTLAIGYDPDRSDLPPAPAEARDDCAAKLELYGRYLLVEDNGACGGINVSFTGIYVRAK